MFWAEMMMDLGVKTISMLPPTYSEPCGTCSGSALSRSCLEMERFLRKKAYRNAPIKIDPSFFDDSDMKTRYHLVVVYDKVTQTPLISCRYYSDRETIVRYLMGDNGLNNEMVSVLMERWSDDVSQVKGELLLADRLSGNVTCQLYRKHRSAILSMLYSEIRDLNSHNSMLLMVRRSPRDQQLNKYLRLGFKLLGSVQHKGKEHWIVIRDLNKNHHAVNQNKSDL